MFGRKETDWKDCLAPEDQDILCQILKDTNKHRCAYMNADDVKIAQLWCAFIEFKKELDSLREMCENTQMPFKSIVELGEIEKRKAIERIIKSMIRPDPDQEEAIQRLVNSLMKF
ncbi:MAG: hypothetical protein QXO27_03470 [Candidatus Aenigmatarchaeota archaeon]